MKRNIFVQFAEKNTKTKTKQFFVVKTQKYTNAKFAGKHLNIKTKRKNVKTATKNNKKYFTVWKSRNNNAYRFDSYRWNDKPEIRE